MTLQNLTLRQDLASAQRNNQESQLKCEDMIHSLKMVCIIFIKDRLIVLINCE